jgi:hypothetical protein
MRIFVGMEGSYRGIELISLTWKSWSRTWRRSCMSWWSSWLSLLELMWSRKRWLNVWRFILKASWNQLRKPKRYILKYFNIFNLNISLEIGLTTSSLQITQATKTKEKKHKKCSLRKNSTSETSCRRTSNYKLFTCAYRSCHGKSTPSWVP